MRERSYEFVSFRTPGDKEGKENALHSHLLSDSLSEPNVGSSDLRKGERKEEQVGSVLCIWSGRVSTSRGGRLVTLPYTPSLLPKLELTSNAYSFSTMLLPMRRSPPRSECWAWTGEGEVHWWQGQREAWAVEVMSEATWLGVASRLRADWRRGRVRRMACQVLKRNVKRWRGGGVGRERELSGQFEPEEPTPNSASRRDRRVLVSTQLHLPSRAHIHSSQRSENTEGGASDEHRKQQ